MLRKKGGDSMDIHEKLQRLLDERGWTKYQLARRCGLSDATIANIFRRNTVPSISTLEAICRGYGITLSQFFAEGEMVELTPELKELFESWAALTPAQKAAAQQMIHAMKQN
jgi:transcriptional regulator with XRE-family HTH domain